MVPLGPVWFRFYFPCMRGQGISKLLWQMSSTQWFCPNWGVGSLGRPHHEETFVTAVPHLVGIVDDDESVRRALRRLVKSAGYQAEAYLAREILEGPMCLVLDVRSRATTTGCRK